MNKIPPLQIAAGIGLIALFYFFPMKAGMFLGCLTVMVAIHEWGHLSSARRHGVTVTEYSIGFGHVIWSCVSKKTGIRYCISMLPLGGYVKMLMTSGDRSEKDVTDLVKEKQGIKYVSDIHPVKQIEIMGAGVFWNMVSAVVFFAMISFFIGVTTVQPLVEVAKAAPGHVTELQKGDYIIAVNGTKTPDANDVAKALMLNASNVSTLTVVRGGCRPVLKCLTVDVKHQMAFLKNGDPYLGFWVGKDAFKHYDRNLTESISDGFTNSFGFLKLQFVAIGRMISGDLPFDKALSGPASMGRIAGDILERELDKVEGFSLTPYFYAFLQFAAPISVALAFMNLLPIPILDGGHIVFAAIEWVRGKPVSQKAKNVAMNLGVLIMFLFMAFAIINDVMKYV